MKMGLEYSPSLCSRRHLAGSLDTFGPFLFRSRAVGEAGVKSAELQRHAPELVPAVDIAEPSTGAAAMSGLSVPSTS
jgi:hypothetical protein